jgi:hypothetical protein
VTRDPQDAAEAHRRYQLNAAYRGVDAMCGWPDSFPIQRSPTMRLTLVRLMVGSHAYRRPLDPGGTPS